MKQGDPKAAPARGNVVDRVVGYFSPKHGQQRVLDRAVLDQMTALGGYIGGDMGRRATRTWRVTRGDANADTLPTLHEQRYRSRDLSRNAPVARGVIDRATTFSVGTGLRCLPEIDREFLRLTDDQADEIEAELTREFNLWAESPLSDASERQTFGEYVGLAVASALESGDCFNVIVPIEQAAARRDWPWQTSVQMFEADQVGTPSGVTDGAPIPDGKDGAGNRIFAGVEVNARNAPRAAHIYEQHPGRLLGTTGGREAERIMWHTSDGRPQVLQLAPLTRPGQVRGVPMLSPVIEPLHQLTTWSRAELFAAVIGAMVTIVHKTQSGKGMKASDPNLQDAYASDEAEEIVLQPGGLLNLKVDDDFDVPATGRPNAQYDPFFMACVREIGAATGIPSEVLLGHFTASYSASRAALEQAQHFFRRVRQWVIVRLCAPVREAVLAESIAAGRISAPGFFSDPAIKAAWLGAIWIGPARISIRPDQEYKAAEIAEDRGWKTAHMNAAELTGADWSRTIEQRGRERRQKEKAGFLPPAPAPGSAPPKAPDEEPPDEEPPDGNDTEEGDRET